MNDHHSLPRTPCGDILPANCPPRGLSRVAAAAYVGISASLFDEMVKSGEAPKATKFRGRVVWDRLKLDLMFEETDHACGRNPFD